ncbi:hypothetical protein KSP39_PZI015444 [Platanthera zijinensis]|uniref:Dihydrolipoamide acetyltransferase component of pyruvate dehydrogenase complex n=1 Tax=Platanthera zijinensis TaxID=2320716 RepID=A0AAP0G197_9ASPA
MEAFYATSSSFAASGKPHLSFSSSLSSSLPALPRHRLLRRRSPARIPAVRAKIREIIMPTLSSTMTEGKIVSWIKSEGDRLSKGDSVVVVESDKADMDVEIFYDGILAAIVVPEGESAPVGAPIGLLAETDDEIALAKAKAHDFSQSQSSPVSPPPPSPVVDAPAPSSPHVASVQAEGPRKLVSTPHAKKLAKQHRVDISTVVGTGPYGRITPADVEAAAGIQPKTPASVAPSSPPPASKGAGTAASAEKSISGFSATSLPPPIPGSTVVTFTAMQAAVAKNMVGSLSVPTFRVGYPVITNGLDALYEKVKSKGVTMTVLLAKAASLALAQHPVVNACCKDEKNFSYNSSINIAIAVAIDGGLITPVLQDADKLDIYLLSQKWKELVKKARSKQLQPDEYNSGTFTLSNLGMFGVDRFDAILPPGQGAIMAVGASKPTVVPGADGFFTIKNKMMVNVTADHRIIYGADLAAFLQTFSKIIENPDSLTL